MTTMESESPQQPGPVWHHTDGWWKCVAHEKKTCLECHRVVKHPFYGKEGQVFPAGAETAVVTPIKPAPAVYSGSLGSRGKLSSVGTQTAAGLACPKCGGTQFTAKRSKKGKLLGITTLGVGGLVAPKSQVKCVTCGTMFKRG